MYSLGDRDESPKDKRLVGAVGYYYSLGCEPRSLLLDSPIFYSQVIIAPNLA